MHIVDDQRSASLEELGRIIEIHKNGGEAVASVNQYEIELGARQLVEYVRRLTDDEPNVPYIYVCRLAIILNSIGFDRRNTGCWQPLAANMIVLRPAPVSSVVKPGFRRLFNSEQVLLSIRQFE